MREITAFQPEMKVDLTQRGGSTNTDYLVVLADQGISFFKLRADDAHKKGGSFAANPDFQPESEVPTGGVP
jgi:hypothetical protein